MVLSCWLTGNSVNPPASRPIYSPRQLSFRFPYVCRTRFSMPICPMNKWFLIAGNSHTIHTTIRAKWFVWKPINIQFSTRNGFNDFSNFFSLFYSRIYLFSKLTARVGLMIHNYFRKHSNFCKRI